MKSTILVLGATGKQGGSVAKYLLKDGSFTVRCATRDPSSPAAQKLRESGCEVVQTNLNDVDSLVQAMKGCYGVFGVTNFWDPTVGYQVEIQQGKNIGLACKQAKVKHLVFSTLDKNSEVPHFESKAIAEEYIHQLGVPCTNLVTSFYFENFTMFFPPKEESDGTLTFAIAQKPTTKVPMFSVDDTGGWVLECFKNSEKYIGTDVAAVGQYLSYPELVQTFTEVTGKKAQFHEVPLDAFAQAGFPGAEELAANLQFFNDLSEGNKEDRRLNLENSQRVWSGAVDWEGWLKRTQWMMT